MEPSRHGELSNTDNHAERLHSVSEGDLRFFIFGNNISHSLSPALHNAGFKELGYPGRYDIHESTMVDNSVEKLIGEPNFRGASVTYPHKLQIGKLLDVVTPRAKSIGAVNTIIVRHSGPRILEGDNTDWSGIKACIVNSNITNFKSLSAIVLGA